MSIFPIINAVIRHYVLTEQYVSLFPNCNKRRCDDRTNNSIRSLILTNRPRDMESLHVWLAVKFSWVPTISAPCFRPPPHSPFVPLSRNMILLALISLRRWLGGVATPSLVKPWTSSSSSKDDEKIVPVEIAYIKNSARFIVSSRMTTCI